MRHALCRFDDIVEGSARSFVVGEGTARCDILLVRKHGAVRAYINSCPHQGTPLEIFPDKLLSEDGTQLVCSTHGARFMIENGYCVSGPCQGKHLVPLDLVVEDGRVFVNLPS